MSPNVVCLKAVLNCMFCAEHHCSSKAKVEFRCLAASRYHHMSKQSVQKEHASAQSCMLLTIPGTGIMFSKVPHATTSEKRKHKTQFWLCRCSDSCQIVSKGIKLCQNHIFVTDRCLLCTLWGKRAGLCQTMAQKNGLVVQATVHP